MMKNKILILSAMMTLIVLISSISAFGVSSPYWEGKPLVIAKGGSETINLNLQNVVGEDDVNVVAEVKKGLDICSLSEDSFVVKAGTSDTMAPVKISIPKDIETGTSQEVQVEFKTVGDDGGIAIGTGMAVSFDVIASEETATSNLGLILGIAIAIIVIIFVLKLFCKKRKK